MNRRPCWIVIFALAALPTAAAADPIRIISQQRFTTASASVVTASGERASDDDTTAPRSADNLSAAASAGIGGNQGFGAGSLSADITPPSFNGVGTVTSSAIADSSASVFGSGGSNYSVTFGLDSRHIFDYDVLFEISGFPGEPFIHSSVALINLISGERIMDSTVFGSAGARRVTQGGVLGPGEYFFSVQQTAQSRLSGPGTVSTNGRFTFAFDLTPLDAAPTPEPGSLLLLGSGVASVLGMRRRKSER